MARRKDWPNGLGFDQGQWSYMRDDRTGGWLAASKRNHSRDPRLYPIWGHGATPEEARANAKPQPAR